MYFLIPLEVKTDCMKCWLNNIVHDPPNFDTNKFDSIESKK